MTQLDVFNYFLDNIKYAFIFAAIGVVLAIIIRSAFKK